MKIQSAIVFSMIAFLMVVTNPDENAYEEYVALRFQDLACGQRQALACSALRALPRNIVKPILKQYSYRQNYVFFSSYQTKFFDLESDSIGIVGLFLNVSDLTSFRKEVCLKEWFVLPPWLPRN